MDNWTRLERRHQGKGHEYIAYHKGGVMYFSAELCQNHFGIAAHVVIFTDGTRVAFMPVTGEIPQDAIPLGEGGTGKVKRARTLRGVPLRQVWEKTGIEPLMGVHWDTTWDDELDAVVIDLALSMTRVKGRAGESG
tara:strand:- start:747 stop:1154 length:408 start_codon:yes stop_codon:yes gene_type:complete